MQHLVLAVLLAVATQGAGAGPLRERLREMRAEHQAAGGETGLPPGAQHLGNIAYGAHPAQRFDVYLPARAESAPVIFMVHGGAWKWGDKEMGRVVDAKVARWVSRGFILVSANYRMLSDAAPDVQLQDVARALAVAQDKAPSWGGDPQRFVLMGHSAGAHLVALLGAAPHYTGEPGLRPVIGTIALDSAAMDVTAIMNHRHLPLYDAPFGKDPAYWQAMSPIHALAPGAAPLLSVCSTRRDDSCRQAAQFAARAGQFGVRAEVLREDLSHGDINAQLGLPGAYTSAVERFLSSLDNGIARRLQ
ncbi:MAG: alpha/beta hydrolase [Zoogloea sp.]|nr:MAG: alpha/beta hydrolase [Zoogloea sp.]